MIYVILSKVINLCVSLVSWQFPMRLKSSDVMVHIVPNKNDTIINNKINHWEVIKTQMWGKTFMGI